jgi:hypothetical protein
MIIGVGIDAFPSGGAIRSSDGVNPQPVLQHSLLDRSEELRPLIEAIDVHGAVFAWAVFNADLVNSAASLHTVRRGVPVGGMRNDFARHEVLGLHRLELRAWTWVRSIPQELDQKRHHDNEGDRTNKRG